ncbi:hypothetical protein [Pseudalkalibacillus sp. SCS-8]|uniref:hypothetical protein n=1 Tax=Pseudalkalibacillus nanhaiensis TaxID=3115291 RepID=UPI0032DAF60C
MNVRKSLVVTGLVMLVGVLTVFGTLKESSVHQFPVPIISQIEEKHDDKGVSYRFKGLNRLYVQHVKLFGWEEVERLGSKGIFEKDGKKVAVTTYKDGFHLKASAQ